jgi:hypothetical protein
VPSHNRRLTLWRLVNSVNTRFVGYDRRVRFRDLAAIPAAVRQPASDSLNFYSAVHNIGNYLPVLGIRKMLGRTSDTWNMHDRSIDFDFINRHYRSVIIGGAGLLDKGFEPFWTAFSRKCRVPAVIWGVGICSPDRVADTGVDRTVFRAAADKCALINFRDDLTADYYGIQQSTISPCPTIVYLEELARKRAGDRDGVLYASHDELVAESERDLIRRQLEKCVGRIRMTDNIQRRLLSLDDIVRSAYGRSRLVVTTRLHGAIIAYGLGIPYVAIARDEKVRAFHRCYGNGALIEDPEQLPEILGASVRCDRTIQYEQVHACGNRMKTWLASV